MDLKAAGKATLALQINNCSCIISSVASQLGPGPGHLSFRPASCSTRIDLKPAASRLDPLLLPSRPIELGCANAKLEWASAARLSDRWRRPLRERTFCFLARDYPIKVARELVPDNDDGAP